MSNRIFDKRNILKNYRKLFSIHGNGPAVAQWSTEGQLFRFEKLSEIGQLKERKILDIGCGLGDLLPFLNEKSGNIKYSGIDIVPELINYASLKYPDYTFNTIDLLEESYTEKSDYVLMSGIFNNEMIGASDFMFRMLPLAFNLCEIGLGFNFISKHVNYVDPSMAYYDPVDIFKFCIENLSKKVVFSHHYERCDVSVFVYR